ncbi:MAG: nitroreductase [Paracoccaceae bacterium]
MKAERLNAALAARDFVDPQARLWVDAVVRQRRSVRAFTDTPVDPDVIAEILEVAARAPSGTNMQPWSVYVVQRPTIARIAARIDAAYPRPERAQWTDYRYYPARFSEPYLSRRRQLGTVLYSLLGIDRRDVSGMRAHFQRNYDFFGAPVGLFITISRQLETGSWIDLGMFMQTLLIAAQARGLATCPQAAFAPFHEEIRPEIGMSRDEVLACGIALGHEDVTAPENALRTARAPLGDWVRFVATGEQE